MYTFNSGPGPPDPPQSAGYGRTWRPRTPQRTAQRSDRKKKYKIPPRVLRFGCTRTAGIPFTIDTKSKNDQ